MFRTFALAANAFSAVQDSDSDLRQNSSSYQPVRPRKDPACAGGSPARLPCLSDGPPPEGTASSASPKSVLIVSADDYLRSTMRSFLEHVGFTALACIDVRRAAQIFFGGSTVDLLLVDAHTLGADGVALAGQCSGGRPDLPVILLAGPDHDPGVDSGVSSAAESIACRAWKKLRKPVVLPVLLGIIRKALEPRKVAPVSGRRSAAVLPFPPASAAADKTSCGVPRSQAAPMARERRRG